MKMARSKLMRYLQGWIGIVGLMAFGNTVSCFRDHSFLAERLYTGAPDEGDSTCNIRCDLIIARLMNIEHDRTLGFI